MAYIEVELQHIRDKVAALTASLERRKAFVAKLPGDATEALEAHGAQIESEQAALTEHQALLEKQEAAVAKMNSDALLKSKPEKIKPLEAQNAS